MTGSKKPTKKSEDENQERCPAWVNGTICTLNVYLSPPDYTPSIIPPAAQYLQEVVLGMTGGEGDPAVKDASHAPRRVGSKPSAIHRMRALVQILNSEASVAACTAIFWLVMGGVFRNLPEEAIANFRSNLGESWYAITLQTYAMGIAGDKDLQDSVLCAMPYAFAQAVYRMLVDGFVEDRPLYIKHGDDILLKASQIAHFELAGFQVTSETVRRGRHRLFLRRVVQSPHVDQQEFLKGKKRQEMLENHSAGTQDRPLQFGDLSGTPLEESQLDHCLFGSDVHRREVQKLVDAGKQAWEMDTTPIPQHLSVARYYELKSGSTILDHQMSELRALLEAPVEQRGFELSPPPVASVASSPHNSEPPSPALSIGHGRGGGRYPSSTPFGASAGDESPPGTAGEGNTFGLDEECPPSPTGVDMAASKFKLHQKLWRKGVLVSRLSTSFKEDARLQKEREAKAKKLRQETVSRCIVDNELPRQLCERALNTSWVSPPMQYLAHVANRHQVLNMTASNDFALTMSVKGELPKRPLSTPLPVKSKPLRRRQLESQLGAAGIATSGSRGGEDSSLGSVRGGATAGISGASSMPLLPRVGGLNLGVGSGSKGETGAAVGKDVSVAGLPRMLATFQTVKALTGGPGGRAATVMSMEPPPRPPKDVVLRRMDEHLKAHERNSFALYAAEHDIYTGKQKTRIDAKTLADQEDAFCAEMEWLVGGQPKRLIAPEGVGTRHLKE